MATPWRDVKYEEQYAEEVPDGAPTPLLTREMAADMLDFWCDTRKCLEVKAVLTGEEYLALLALATGRATVVPNDQAQARARSAAK